MIASLTPTPVVADTPLSIIRPPLGVVVFSRYDPATKRFRLAERSASGEVGTFRIRSRKVAFDVDVGPDEHGREVAVYSRCAVEPALGSPGAAMTYYRTGSACRLYELSLATGHERRLKTTTERSGPDFLPSIWRGRLAWVHVERGALTLRLRDGGRVRRLPAGTASADRLGGELPAPGVIGLDLRDDRLSLVWSYYDLHDSCGADPPFGRTPVDEVWSYRFGLSRRRVAHAGCRGDAAARIGWARRTPSGLSYSATIAKAETLVGPTGRTPLTIPAGTNFVQSFARLDDGRTAVTWDGSTSGLAVGRAQITGA
ncbi:MAG TPA: hypothetical protein VGO71_21110 [Baekduia sp.]|jgi:hypothetical protein|nr:hypothetical protein [Baekduia sp.]